MRVIRREFFNLDRSSVFRIVPLGDIHLGAGACNEERLRQVVDYIANTPDVYWVGMGDYCDFINRSDPRFSPAVLAKWIKMQHLGDLAQAQRDRFLQIVEPIAAKCLAMAEGNHETAITRHYERAIFNELVCGIKEKGNIKGSLGMGYNGWLLLSFFRSDKRKNGRQIKINIHHGFVGGRLAGAKALNMQRWLWSHDCDIAIFGHSHNTGTQIEAIEQVSGQTVTHKRRYGVYAGTFLDSFTDGASTYSEVKGYFPLPNAGAEIILKPGARDRNDMIRIITA